MKSKDSKKITVIIRAYNSEKFIKNSINSALNQTLNKKDYEVLVVDDGSEDGTREIIKKEYKNHVSIVLQKHLGSREAVYAGIKKSRGRYIIFLDSDDEFLPEILEKMLNMFEREKEIDFVYCDYFEKKLGRIKKVSLKKNIFKSLWCAIMFKKELFGELGLPDAKLFFSEYDFLIKLLKAKKKGRYIGRPMYIYNRGKNSITSDKKKVKKGILELKNKYGKIAEKIRKY